MERKVIFRDYQEQAAADHNNLQAYVQESTDDIVKDAVSPSRRYSAFTVSKTGQVEVTIAPGRVYNSGAVFARRTSLVQSFAVYTAAAAKRIVTISAYGQTNETDVQTRDYLVDTDTGEVEPRAVSLTSSRDAQLVFTAGAEAAEPLPAPIPATHVAIAHVLMDATQVVSVTMVDENKVTSTDELDQRSDVLEAFKDQIGPRVNSLASDLASLANRLNQKGQTSILSQLMQDMGRVKERLEIPDTAADYGSDRFLSPDESDTANASALAYDAFVEEGARFADANADEVEMDIFSANDPNASKHTSGLLLPAYDNEVKLAVTERASELGISQYGFQTFNMTQLSMSRQRTRYGSVFSVCSNAAWWQAGVFDSATQTFQKDGETFEVLAADWDWYKTGIQPHTYIRVRQVWVDPYQEPYWSLVTSDHSITGAQVAQSFLIANDMWLTQLGFYLTAKGANENVYLSVCEIVNGVPDPTKVVMHQMVNHTDLKVNDWTRVAITPTFLRSGKRYALLLTSNANHKVGMASGQKYTDGTFFYSTDGSYFLGDLTKDMMFELWGAKFRSPQVVIELEPLNLDGGIQAIDVMSGRVEPHSTQLILEVQPSGSGEWIPLEQNSLGAFTTTPPLVHFRARFVGTRDIMPGLLLTGSRVKVRRPKLTFKHISTVQTLAAASTEIYVKLLLENFDDTPHDVTCQLRDIVGAATVNPAVTTEVTIQDVPNISGRIERTYKFTLGVARTTFRIIINGTTNSASNTFHASERVHWSI